MKTETLSVAALQTFQAKDQDKILVLQGQFEMYEETYGIWSLTARSTLQTSNA